MMPAARRARKNTSNKYSENTLKSVNNMLKIFTLKYEERTESFNDSVLSTFLADKEILRWESHFFEHKNEYFWTVLVEYRSTSQTEPVRKTEKRIEESYKELLTESDWPLFNVLREWRAERCKEEGIPPYIICNNTQLAKITVTRPTSLNALHGIEGIGKSKLEKYGKEMLHIIASHGKPVNSDKKEGQNG
jgi:superfamily II DNA helicase RecQ